MGFSQILTHCLLPLVECTTSNGGNSTATATYVTSALFYLSAGDCLSIHRPIQYIHTQDSRLTLFAYQSQYCFTPGPTHRKRLIHERHGAGSVTADTDTTDGVGTRDTHGVDARDTTHAQRDDGALLGDSNHENENDPSADVSTDQSGFQNPRFENDSVSPSPRKTPGGVLTAVADRAQSTVKNNPSKQTSEDPVTVTFVGSSRQTRGGGAAGETQKVASARRGSAAPTPGAISLTNRVGSLALRDALSTAGEALTLHVQTRDVAATLREVRLVPFTKSRRLFAHTRLTLSFYTPKLDALRATLSGRENRGRGTKRKNG